jgi:N6-adenosine-specific RNA methylase IME4
MSEDNPRHPHSNLPDLTEPVAKWAASSAELYKALVGERLVDENRVRHVMHKMDRKRVAKDLADKGLSTREIAKITGVDHSTIVRDLGGASAPETGADAPPDEHAQSAKREAALRDQLRIAQTPVAMPDQQYGTIVIDPPWPMKKIEREVRPNQVEFDYPTMDYEQLRAFRATFQRMTAKDCHVFMWTTQKFLPMALRLFEDYEIKYVLTMVWHKPGGFQPVGLPQYNCEFILYGRIGAPDFIDTKAFDCCFVGARREHSRKPVEFYELIERVTDGPRLDMFAREAHDGFAQFGNEPERFAGAAE